ncbi:peroxiredoxin [Deinococcus puniceus]|uniref:thioredoxin-dependent peroxiredoxin n=1 Tax=Deinococcus puniceus TaxID=1182568 RepID=A0A172TCZ5_9DEIO|nr:peroxiredoxin [Deinococcus puniceus]ANE44826.1 alkyl hydroperoxide reductase [Deinococcus puniceus]
MTTPDAPETPETSRLQPGEAFPAFALPDADGKTHALADYAGNYVVLYVYPKDDTPGCTKEACDFRDSAPLRAVGAAILGLSRDDAGSHTAFAEKYSLPFPLLSDPDATFMKEIGSYGPKTLYGKTSDGVKRQTFVIDPQGKLVKSWLAVKVEGRADAVAAAIAADQVGHA